MVWSSHEEAASGVIATTSAAVGDVVRLSSQRAAEHSCRLCLLRRAFCFSSHPAFQSRCIARQTENTHRGFIFVDPDQLQFATSTHKLQLVPGNQRHRSVLAISRGVICRWKDLAQSVVHKVRTEYGEQTSFAFLSHRGRLCFEEESHQTREQNELRRMYNAGCVVGLAAVLHTYHRTLDTSPSQVCLGQHTACVDTKTYGVFKTLPPDRMGPLPLKRPPVSWCHGWGLEQRKMARRRSKTTSTDRYVRNHRQRRTIN